MLLTACSQQPDPFHRDAETGRWYSKSQLHQGQTIYNTYCSQCHGGLGQGADSWHKRDAQGLYPPPPLNGSGHSWHHPLDSLYKTISEGSGQRMPAWEQQLDQQQIIAVIAYFQGWWPEQAYQRWLQRQRR